MVTHNVSPDKTPPESVQSRVITKSRFTNNVALVTINKLILNRKNRIYIIFVFFLAGSLDHGWNLFLADLIRFSERLEELGFRYVDGKVIVIDEEENCVLL